RVISTGPTSVCAEESVTGADQVAAPAAAGSSAAPASARAKALRITPLTRMAQKKFRQWQGDLCKYACDINSKGVFFHHGRFPGRQEARDQRQAEGAPPARR